MHITRRTVTLGLIAGTLTACGGGVPPAVRSAAPAPQLKPVSNPGFDTWVAGFRARAAGKGISAATLERAFRDVGYLPGVIERDRNQTEFKRSLEDYLAIAASDKRISTGRAMLQRHRALLAEIEGRYGVPPQVVTAFWGLESQYGERRGDIPLISALSTLAYDGRRGAFFEKQLIAALRILQKGDITPDRMTGSWAGAMGHTQFIPTSYQAYAVDFRGDGRRDIWSEDPTDGLASTANYLVKAGWRRGQPWGLEVKLPDGFNTGQAGRGTKRGVGEWTAQGVRDMNGRPVANHGAASILIPAGAGGPTFMVFGNFNVILRYNNAESYAIGIGHLSDRLIGGGPIRASFGPDRTGLTLEDRKELQRLLTAKGFDTDGADGVIGPKSIAAIKAYQRSQGLAETGQPSPALLRRLR